ncbi:MAG: hypothetical protein A3J38_07665 [Gammaproteobacteria bacterium RIFCSPHIGHO2_12_FULL_45_9]|nr:MAG: hypothetical protein A3J38_07665 [Gammaproteobacteria bacterium RIFCSPHIGHO2_12_FULL_45_9]
MKFFAFFLNRIPATRTETTIPEFLHPLLAVYTRSTQKKIADYQTGQSAEKISIFPSMSTNTAYDYHPIPDLETYRAKRYTQMLILLAEGALDAFTAVLKAPELAVLLSERIMSHYHSLVPQTEEMRQLALYLCTAFSAFLEWMEEVRIGRMQDQFLALLDELNGLLGPQWTAQLVHVLNEQFAATDCRLCIAQNIHNNNFVFLNITPVAQYRI